MGKCDCGYCSDKEFMSDYDDIIAQLKETRDNIDQMIHALENRKIKDNVINQILQTEYEEEDEEVSQEAIDWIMKMIEDNKNNSTRVNNYTLPWNPNMIRYKSYPFRWYTYF